MPNPTLPQPHWHPVWSPVDYHQTWERACTFQAELAAQADDEVVV